MHFSYFKDGSGARFSNIAVVAALHVAAGAALVHNMDSKVFSVPQAEEVITILPLKCPPPDLD